MSPIGERIGFDGGQLATASRLVAKVDSAAVQDGFELYLHGFVVADDGRWVVVQQGMNGERKQARRYHWLSEGLKSFVDEPHAAIEGHAQGEIINLTDRRAEASRKNSSNFSARSVPTASRASSPRSDRRSDAGAVEPAVSRHAGPSRCSRRKTFICGACTAISLRRPSAAPTDFADLLLTPGVGGRTVRALALVAEVVHGAPCRFSDPARFSLAHGGKDRIRFRYR